MQCLYCQNRGILSKLFNFENTAQFYVICPNCSNCLGKKTEINNVVNCDMCGSSIKISNLSSSNSFAILHPAAEISNLVQSHADYYNYVVCERQNAIGEIKDI